MAHAKDENVFVENGEDDAIISNGQLSQAAELAFERFKGIRFF